LQKMKSYPGFIAALDQSGGSTPGALLHYGIQAGAWTNEAEMFALVHQMRTRTFLGGLGLLLMIGCASPVPERSVPQPCFRYITST